MRFQGPGSAFELLFEQASRPGIGLPDELKAIYGGDWVIPEGLPRPYSYSNFVMSHDGRISFNIEGHEGGGDVSGFNRHDQWLMALARGRADAVVVGANTLRTEHEHQWTSEYIFPQEAEAFDSLRAREGRAKTPLQVIVTASGQLNQEAAIFSAKNLRVLIVTTAAAAGRFEAFPEGNVEVIVLGEDSVDLPALYELLYTEYGCNSILCEGGPRLYGELIRAAQLDEEFLTVSPVVIGSSDREPRPGLIQGVSFGLDSGISARLASVRRAGDHLFLRTRWR